MKCHLYISTDNIQTTLITDTAVSTSVVVGIAVGIIALVVGFLAGIPIYHCVISHWFMSFKPHSSFHQQQEESSNALQQTGPEYEEVVQLSQNRAYDLADTSIQMNANEAYQPVQHWTPLFIKMLLALPVRIFATTCSMSAVISVTKTYNCTESHYVAFVIFVIFMRNFCCCKKTASDGHAECISEHPEMAFAYFWHPYIFLHF